MARFIAAAAVVIAVVVIVTRPAEPDFRLTVHPGVVAVAEAWCDEVADHGWPPDGDQAQQRLIEYLDDREAAGGWSLAERGYGWQAVREYADRELVCES